MNDTLSRAAGALYGLAVGDALGMPTQSLPREQIVASYGALIDGFELAVAIEAGGAEQAAVVEQLKATARVLLGC